MQVHLTREPDKVVVEVGTLRSEITLTTLPPDRTRAFAQVIVPLVGDMIKNGAPVIFNEAMFAIALFVDTCRRPNSHLKSQVVTFSDDG